MRVKFIDSLIDTGTTYSVLVQHSGLTFLNVKLLE